MASQNDDACLQSTSDRASRISKLNDSFRKGRGEGQLFLTEGIIALGQGAAAEVLALLRDFDDFSKDNDPYGEHDFGAFSYRGERVFWKIDYYDRSLRYGSEDPADPKVTTRVLTVMLAREY